MDAAEKRHLRFYTFFAGILPVFLRPKFNFKGERAPSLEGPCLVLANHNTDYDPLMVANSFRDKHLYFVASEHIFRAGIWSVLLNRYLAPISRMKGGTDASAALGVLRALKKGHSVCLFAEGDRSWNGETCPIHPATAKLVKSAGATLVTYRLTGGYLTSPRWSSSLRKGEMRGAVAGVYAPDRLAAMSAGQLGELIARDLYENAYERQKGAPVAFRGRKLAERIETALYLCPNCGKYEALRSKDDGFWCEACGARGAYAAFGALTGDFPFDNVLDWDRYQLERLRERAQKAAPETVLFSDDGFALRELSADHRAERVAGGALSMSKASLRCGGAVFPLADVAQMSMFGRAALVFTANGRHYELRPETVKCTRKYLELYKILQS